MPVIYRVAIEREDQNPAQLPTGAAGAWIQDQENGGKLASFYLALRKDNDWFPIRHPVETFDLRNHGETFGSAARKGILFELHPYLCLFCGEVIDKPRVRFQLPFSAALPVLLGGAMVFITNFRYSYPLIKAILYGATILCFFSLIIMILNLIIGHLRFGSKAQRLTLQNCPVCSYSEFKSITSLSGKAISLGNGQKAEITIAGKS